VFRNVGIYNSDAGELPKRKHNIFRTRRKFEIKVLCKVYDSALMTISFDFINSC